MHVFELEMAEGPADESCNTLPRQAPHQNSTFYSYSLVVGNEVELSEDQEQSRRGRKRRCNPEKWTKKPTKRPGLRKNSPLPVINSEAACCKKKCPHEFTSSHLNKLRSEFRFLFYEQQNI